jgi:hypothetical protein
MERVDLFGGSGSAAFVGKARTNCFRLDGVKLLAKCYVEYLVAGDMLYRQIIVWQWWQHMRRGCILGVLLLHHVSKI